MTVLFAKNSTTTQRPGSTVKIITALVMWDWINGSALGTRVTVAAEDTVYWPTNSNMGLLAGDQLSYRDLLYGLMIASGNDAARTIARTVGALIVAAGGPGTSPEPATRFIQAMNLKAAAAGAATAVLTDAAGLDMGNLMSADDLCQVMIAYCAVPFLVEVDGTMNHLVTIYGANARTYNIKNHTDPESFGVDIPELICGKTGWVTYNDPALNSGGCMAALWEAPSGARRITSLLGSTNNSPVTYQDLRKLIDYELARLGEL